MSADQNRWDPHKEDADMKRPHQPTAWHLYTKQRQEMCGQAEQKPCAGN